MRRAGVRREVETFTAPQNVPQASATQDSLAKNLYVRKFDMLDNLQQVFKELTIRTEQKQCASEGIAWSRIHFYDNVFVCMLIESSGRGGFSKNKFSTRTKPYQYTNRK